MVFEITDALFHHALQNSEEHKHGTVVIKKAEKEEVTEACIGLLSDVNYYRVEYTCDDIEYVKSLVVKVPFNKACFEISKTRGYYDSEYILYDVIIPEMTKLGMQITPKPYKSSENLVIILDNLITQGYRNIDKYKQLNFEQTTEALKLLARLHATSYKVNEIKPELLTFFKRKIEIGRYVVSQLTRGFEAMLKFIENHSDLTPYYSYMRKAVDNFRVDPQILCRYGENHMMAVNHGDYYVNNILFKDTENGLDTKMIDFQCARWVSPIFDVIKFSVLSIQFEVFEEHSEQFYRSYVQEYDDTLKKLNCDRSYTVDQFRMELKYNRYNYLPQISIFLRALYAPTDTVIADESNNDAINLEKMFYQDHTKEVHYKERLSKWLKYLKEYNILEIDE